MITCAAYGPFGVIRNDPSTSFWDSSRAAVQRQRQAAEQTNRRAQTEDQSIRPRWQKRPTETAGRA